jgi:hypothetical protein
VKRGGWLPLFDGEEALDVYKVIDAIAAALRPKQLVQRVPSFSLMDPVGVSVMYAYLDRVLPGREYLRHAEAAIDQAI